MNNNPFEVNDKKYKRNPFEADKSKKKSNFLVSLIIVVAIFVITYNVNIELTPQQDTIGFDFDNPIPGLYVANWDIDPGSYTVNINNQETTQTNSLEYIPTMYDGDDYTFLCNDGDELIVDANSAIMYYDTATTLKHI